MKRVLVITFQRIKIIFFLPGPRVHNQGQTESKAPQRLSSYYFETREISDDELDNPPPNDDLVAVPTKKAGGKRDWLGANVIQALDSKISLINNLAGAAISLIEKNKSDVKPQAIGQAIPKGVDPLALEGSKRAYKNFEKVLKSTLGARLIHMQYRIAYEYGASYEEAGHYVTNISFIPISLKTDPIWSIDTSALSDLPSNIGDKEDPIAFIRFVITFTAKGVGTRAATDEFGVNGSTGKLIAVIRDLSSDD